MNFFIASIIFFNFWIAVPHVRLTVLSKWSSTATTTTSIFPFFKSGNFLSLILLYGSNCFNSVSNFAFYSVLDDLLKWLYSHMLVEEFIQHFVWNIWSCGGFIWFQSLITYSRIASNNFWLTSLYMPMYNNRWGDQCSPYILLAPKVSVHFCGFSLHTAFHEPSSVSFPYPKEFGPHVWDSCRWLDEKAISTFCTH